MVLRAYQKHYYNYLQNESNLQFLSHVIINTKVLLHHVYVILADFGYPVYAILFYCSHNFKLLRFVIFLFWAYLMWIFQQCVVRTNLDIYVLLFYGYSKTGLKEHYHTITLHNMLYLNDCWNHRFFSMDSIVYIWQVSKDMLWMYLKNKIQQQLCSTSYMWEFSFYSHILHFWIKIEWTNNIINTYLFSTNDEEGSTS
jgi:hypothetical protein